MQFLLEKGRPGPHAEHPTRLYPLAVRHPQGQHSMRETGPGDLPGATLGPDPLLGAQRASKKGGAVCCHWALPCRGVGSGQQGPRLHWAGPGQDSPRAVWSPLLGRNKGLALKARPGVSAVLRDLSLWPNDLVTHGEKLVANPFLEKLGKLF